MFSIVAIIVAVITIIAISKARYAANKPCILAIENKIGEGDSLMSLKQFDKAYLAYENGIESYRISYKQQMYHF